MNTPSMRNLKKTLPVILSLTVLAATPTFAVDYTRATGAGAVGNWTDTSKWTPNTDSPKTVSDTAIFNTAATQRTVTLDADVLIGVLEVGYNATAATIQTGNIRLEGNKSLTVGSSVTPGSIYIGVQTSGTATGTLTIGSGVSVNLVGAGSSFNIGGYGSDTSAGQMTGTVMMEAGSNLNIGSSSNRSQWYIGRKTTTTNQTDSGSFSATGGSLAAYLTTLAVGENTRGSNQASVHKGVGTLNLTGLTSATINTNNLVIGKSSEMSASGSLTVGNGHTLAVGAATSGTIEIGVRSSGNGAFSASNNIGTTSGTLTLGAGSISAFGTESSRTAVTLGLNGGRRGTVMNADGTIVASAGSTFSGYLSSLTLGHQKAVEVSGTAVLFRATGIMDLRQADVTAFDVSGDVTIGSGTVVSGSHSQGSQGELRLPETSGRIGGNLIVGDSQVGGGSQVSTSGLLDLVGTHLEVNGNVTFNLTGQADVTVNGKSSGLLLSETSTFTLTLAGANATDANSAYFITFNDAEEDGIYYGLAWQGNHLTVVQSLIDSHKITWVNNMTGGYTPGAFYDLETNLTYVGISVIPEPSSVLLMLTACGGLGMVLRRRNAVR